MQGFDALLANATQGVAEHYFQLPVAGKENPSYRERVYCYELYHQLRLRWPAGSDFSLAGEVDKRGHPLVRGNGLDSIKPDMLVHMPGNMGANYAAIEVKSVLADAAGLAKDLRTLTAFRRHGEYGRAIFLIYGSPADGPKLFERLHVAARMEPSLVQLQLIEVWQHAAPGQAALRVND